MENWRGEWDLDCFQYLHLHLCKSSVCVFVFFNQLFGGTLDLSVVV